MIRYIGISVALKEHVKQQAIQGTEDANHQSTQDEEGAHVLVHPLCNGFQPAMTTITLMNGSANINHKRNAIKPRWYLTWKRSIHGMFSTTA